MAVTFLGYPFDEELFFNKWSTAPDPIKTAMINSGILVNDSSIAEQIQGGGSLYTIPFYDVLSGDPTNYDGNTDIKSSETTASSQTGVVYGRAKGFTARNFVAELSGADPMGHIASSVATYWQKQRQAILLKILDGIFSITGTGNDELWRNNHIVDLSSTTDTPYKISETDLNDVATRAMGDGKSAFGLAIMHSNVAKTLENKQLLEYWKYTDANGLQRPMNIAQMSGYVVIVDDNVPTEIVGGEGDNKDLTKYTTYLLGNGCIRQANGKLLRPNDVDYDPAKNGGQETLYTRIRETLHPNGFSFNVPDDWTQSPTNAQLSSGDCWSVIHDPKAIPIAKLITNG